MKPLTDTCNLDQFTNYRLIATTWDNLVEQNKNKPPSKIPFGPENTPVIRAEALVKNKKEERLRLLQQIKIFKIKKKYKDYKRNKYLLKTSKYIVNSPFTTKKADTNKLEN